MTSKEIIAGCGLTQDGKALAAAPESGTVCVRPIAGGPFVQVSGPDVVATLRADFPKCQFLWLSKPVEKKAKGKKDKAAGSSPEDSADADATGDKQP